MKRGIARGAVASLALAFAAWSSSAWALDPGNYTIKCTSPDSAQAKVETFDIRMDMVDLLTMKDTYGAVISGVRLDDGRRVILTGDYQSCAMIGLSSKYLPTFGARAFRSKGAPK